jgi:hypothetical protein
MPTPTDGFIQVNPDSAGKKLQTFATTVGANAVHRQAVVIGAGNSDDYVSVGGGQAAVIVSDGFIRIHDAFYSSRCAYVSEFGRLRVGMDTMLFYDAFDGTQFNYNQWTSAATTMTLAQANSFLTLNNSALTTINTTARIETQKDFLFLGQFPLYMQFKAKTNITPIANATIEAGFITCTGSSAPTDGVFYRWSPTGVFQCVVNTGGAETVVTMTAPTVNVVHTFEILIQNRLASFTLDGGTPTTVTFSNTVPTAWTNQQCPGGARVFTGATIPATAPQLSISEFNVAQVDVLSGRDWEEQLAIGMARACWQKPVFATDWAQTASWSNTAQAASAAVLTNTTAPNAWQAALGGEFAFQQPTGTATDFILFAYQVPAGRTLVIRRINISPLVVTGAAGVGGPIQMFWGAGFNCSAVSLATAEAPPTTWSPRRIALGISTLPVTPAVGAMSSPAVPIDIDMGGGVGVVESGNYLHLFVKIIGGTATATSIWRGTAQISGTFE